MNQLNAPFKFLDAYQENDSEVFFGREQETEALYDALSGVKHLLVYGPSGAGKTSLIECGLRNQFSDADWFAITIRRQTNINQSIYRDINNALDEKIELDKTSGLPSDGTFGFGQAVEQLFNERFQPVYLLFDQFEELLLLGSQEEKDFFFRSLNELIRYRVACRVILIMREEFVGHLSEFESFCPTLFKHRFRLEKMGRSNVRQLIYQILEAPLYSNAFEVEDSELLADSILNKLPDQKKEIELTHVQVFLSELWDRAVKAQSKNVLPVLTIDLVREEDNLAGVLDAFLKKQLQELGAVHGEKVPLELLAVMISEKHTKLQVTLDEIQEELANNQVQTDQPVIQLIQNLEAGRILRAIRTGEENRYEISHDVLAYVVGQNLTEEIQLREKANDVYKVYEDRKGYFSPEELDYLRPYQQYKAYPQQLKQRILESEKFHKAEQAREVQEAKAQAAKELALVEEKLAVEQAAKEAEQQSARRQRRYTLLIGVVALLSVFAGIIALQQRNKAVTAREETNTALIQLQAEQGERQKADLARIEALENQRRTNYERYFNEGKSFMRMGEYSLAIQQLRVALAFDSTKQDTINLLIRESNDRVGVTGQFEDLMQQGSIDQEQNKLLSAMNRFQSAFRLNVDPSRKQGAKNKIDETAVKMLPIYRKLVNDAETFRKASSSTNNSCDFALSKLKEAKKYEPYLSVSSIREQAPKVVAINKECPE